MNPGAGGSSEGPEMAAAYRDDLAYIHDAGFGGFAREAGCVLVNALRRRRITEGLVIDLGCGSGVLSGVVSGSGYRALGGDRHLGEVWKERLPGLLDRLIWGRRAGPVTSLEAGHGPVGRQGQGWRRQPGRLEAYEFSPLDRCLASAGMRLRLRSG